MGDNIYQTFLLTSAHKKDGFSCGKPQLDNYLHFQATQDMKRKLSACFVMINVENKIVGYFTLSSSSIPREIVPDELRRKLPAYKDMPVTLLGRLAVDSISAGKSYGKFLLIDALKRSHESSSSIGSIAVIVDPIDNDAIKFYERFGFIYLPGSGKMFLPMKTISQLFDVRTS